MPVVLGVGLSHSPLLYRPRSHWPDIHRLLAGDIVQPTAFAEENDEVLGDYERRIQTSFATVGKTIESGDLGALVVLCADRGTVFDDSNVPQVHVQVGGDVWGDVGIGELGEQPRLVRFRGESAVADLIGEELVRAGFDISEGRGAFTPAGAGGQGISLAAGEAVSRLAGEVPVAVVHVNCHVAPTLSGPRLHALGVELARACDLTAERVGLLVTGGMSGDPGGPMAGRIDDVLDDWVLSRLVRGQTRELAGMWAARSRTLVGSSAEIRLWVVAGAALATAGLRARVVDYLPVRHAGTGIAFVTWERETCRSSWE